MLTDQEKRFFGTTAHGASTLSSCPVRHGAVLVRGHKILSTGHNRRIIKSKSWECSAIFDAVFGARDLDLTGSILFSTRFPDLEDMKLLVSAGITSLYFFGEVTDPAAVDLSNSLPLDSIPLEVVQLQ